MQSITQTAGELLDFARDFFSALPGFLDQEAPVIFLSLLFGAIIGAKLALAWHGYCERSQTERAAAARKWKLSREASVRI